MNDLCNQLAAKAVLVPSGDQAHKLSQFLDLLLAANQTMNLTRISDRARAEVLHIGDALTLLPHLPRAAHRLADVGSGGGVPGIPLAIVRPDVQVTLLESTKKKAAFLERAARELGLRNIRIVAERAEVVGRGALCGAFDIAVARALAPLPLLAAWCLPLVKVGGRVLAMKGLKWEEEVASAGKAIKALRGEVIAVHPADLPGIAGHVIVEIRKTGPAGKQAR